MRKIIIITLLILRFIPVTAQDVDTDSVRVYFLEEHFNLYEISIEVWWNPVLMTLKFEDYFSRNFDKATFQLGLLRLMNVFEFKLEDSGQIFEDLDVKIKTMIYSFFLVIDDKVRKYNESNLRHSLFMERSWCIEFFQVNRQEKQEMLCDLFDEHYSEWFLLKDSFN